LVPHLEFRVAYRDERVDRFETSLHGLVNGATGENTGGLELGLGAAVGLDGALAVNGVTQSIDDTTEKAGADGNIDNLAGTLDRVALLNETVVTENGDTDVVRLEVEAHAANTRGKLHHLLGLNIAETVNTGDTVTDGCVVSNFRRKGKQMEATLKCEFRPEWRGMVSMNSVIGMDSFTHSRHDRSPGRHRRPKRQRSGSRG
jgi:hypothetical protein